MLVHRSKSCHDVRCDGDFFPQREARRGRQYDFLKRPCVVNFGDDGWHRSAGSLTLHEPFCVDDPGAPSEVSKGLCLSFEAALAGASSHDCGMETMVLDRFRDNFFPAGAEGLDAMRSEVDVQKLRLWVVLKFAAVSMSVPGKRALKSLFGKIRFCEKRDRKGCGQRQPCFSMELEDRFGAGISVREGGSRVSACELLNFRWRKSAGAQSSADDFAGLFPAARPDESVEVAKGLGMGFLGRSKQKNRTEEGGNKGDAMEHKKPFSNKRNGYTPPDRRDSSSDCIGRSKKNMLQKNLACLNERKAHQGLLYGTS